MNSQDSSQRLIYFIVLWAIAAYVHQLARAFWFPTKIGHLFIFATILVFLKPQSLWRFALFLFLSILNASKHIPFLANHLTFECLTNIGILSVIVISSIQKKSLNIDMSVLYSRIAPFLRCSTILLYTFAFLAKLNKDFFIPEYSCGVQLFLDVIYFFPIFPNWLDHPKILNIVIYMTVLIEFLIPVFLLVPRFRHRGIIIGIFFHFFMGLLSAKGVYSFSMLSCVLYFLFISDEVFERMKGYVNPWVQFFKDAIPQQSLRQLIIVFFIYAPQWANNQFYKNVWYGFPLWMLLMIILCMIYLFSMRKAQPQGSGFCDFFIPQSRIYLIFLLPALLNFVSPYTGLKTQASMTMFSNLRILGDKPNHFFMPKSLRFAKHEFIEIISSNHASFQKYAGKKVLLTKFEFHRYTSTRKFPFTVTYRYRDRVRTLDSRRGGEDAEEFLTPIPLIKRKVLRYKPVDTTKHGRCRW